MTTIAPPAPPDPVRDMAEAISQVGLAETAIDLLQAVRSGVDIWDDQDAVACRALERLGLVLIGPPERAPSHGAMRQPFFACIISHAGRVVLERALQARLRRLATTPHPSPRSHDDPR